MSPDDPRHGTYAGHNAGCRLDCCTTAARNYQKRRLYDHHHGRPRLVPAIGAHRRLRALCALGWTFQDIAERLGTTRQAVHSIHRNTTIQADRHRAIAAIYDQLSMVEPPDNRYTTRQRHLANQRGWAPPLAWDERSIDDPAAQPALDTTLEPDDLDHVVVLRILMGDASLARAATPAERRAVVARWPSTGRSLNDLADLTGWKPERYHPAAEGSAA